VSVRIIQGDALTMLDELASPDLVATDPPYAFGGSGDEHAISATVAVVLREAARKLNSGRWMLIMCASSWRSTSYMVEAVRGILEPVRIAHWDKPAARTKVQTSGWQWASVHVVACRKGKAETAPAEQLDHILAEPVRNGRRAELPPKVADWMVRPFAVPGGLMIDPFAGSGALCHSASAAGMRAIGIEKKGDVTDRAPPDERQGALL
jgi:DNA modification methylase